MRGHDEQPMPFEPDALQRFRAIRTARHKLVQRVDHRFPVTTIRIAGVFALELLARQRRRCRWMLVRTEVRRRFISREGIAQIMAAQAGFHVGDGDIPVNAATAVANTVGIALTIRRSGRSHRAHPWSSDARSSDSDWSWRIRSRSISGSMRKSRAPDRASDGAAPWR